ncbi:hypothetical protein NIES4075_10750 [Tolypothrix sp. NIES-4075]|nr:hypothetical protein NIES4075_10750 [Tolypothrix sp. NIES-4075]
MATVTTSFAHLVRYTWLIFDDAIAILFPNLKLPFFRYPTYLISQVSYFLTNSESLYQTVSRITRCFM